MRPCQWILGPAWAEGAGLPTAPARSVGRWEAGRLSSSSRREEEMQRQVWERVMCGLSMPGYTPAEREGGTTLGVEKSAVSDRFIPASARRAQELLSSDLRQVHLCVVMLDGAESRVNACRPYPYVPADAQWAWGYARPSSESQKAREVDWQILSKRGLDFYQPDAGHDRRQQALWKPFPPWH